MEVLRDLESIGERLLSQKPGIVSRNMKWKEWRPCYFFLQTQATGNCVYSWSVLERDGGFDMA